MAKIDWDYWRLRYVASDDLITLEALSREPKAPALNTLKKRSSRESWAEQRDRFRHQRDTLAHQDAKVVSAASEIQKLIDTAAMITRHAQLCQLMGRIAAYELQQLRRKQLEGEATGLKPDDVLKLARAAIADERLTEGLATQRQEIDLSSMTDAELEKLANGGT
jgi:hypothetical protein